jgi:adenylate cyclase
MNHPAYASGTTGTKASGVVDRIMGWLVEQALQSTQIHPLFTGLCERLFMAGIPIDRVSVTWPALHPMFNAERLLWQQGAELDHTTFVDADDAQDDWQQSPMRYLLESDADILRRRLTGPRALVDFPLLHELVEEGFNDYFAMKTYFSIPRIGDGGTGILASWCTKRDTGFVEEEVAILSTIQRQFAVAFRGCVQNDVMRTIGRVYLGPTAANRVLSGQIRRGDGQVIDAAIWISDLRNSTALSEAMPLADYLSLLDTYFECTGGAVLEQGGEILDFVGDSVIAIFPLDEHQATQRATRAAIHARENLLMHLNDDPDLPMAFGIGITAGSVMHGNFGTPDRLVFSAIGPSVNEAARIEKLTKFINVPILASASIARKDPEHWTPVGEHRLDGVSKPVPLFSANL